MLILNGDCLELLKEVPDQSIDLIFCDLPYGQTSCKWDCKIDLDKLWIEFMRVKKLNTPLFFTTTTKFGVELINSAPKQCFFRYDIVWVKSAPAGFLSAKKMPMRKHEMVYVFYEKLPFYDLSSHKHKFVKERDAKQKNGEVYGGEEGKKLMEGKYQPPLPVSVIKEPSPFNSECYGTDTRKNPLKRLPFDGKGGYDPPLPVSVVKEPEPEPEPELIYGKNANWGKKHYTSKERASSVYEPPLPTSICEVKSTRGKHSTEKPVALMEWILKYYSKEGDVVLDPTMGSGSMGVACLNLNRDFVGFEKDDEIFEVACQRLIPG
tara:strand:- start:353 stop:1315 length:963 start_codon:yes stop_codon:yes gene_type:complete